MSATLAEAINALLPQTQCRRCGYDGCQPYAQALAEGCAEIDQCPPGGAALVRRLALLLERPLPSLSMPDAEPACVALIDEQRCIGCYKCIAACPVDAIVGARQLMHTVIAAECSGCALCLAPCPVDCITLQPRPPQLPAHAQLADFWRGRHRARAAPGAAGAGTRRNAAPQRAFAARASAGFRHRRRRRPRPRQARRPAGQDVKAADIAELYRRLAELDPEPRSELVYSSPFELLCAVVLSAQATDVGVNKATARLYAVANTPRQLLQLGEAGLREYIRSIGLYQTKAKNLIRLAQLLLERHGGAVPRSRDALEALPGVGRKTASVVLNVAFGEPAIAVDTHIFRVANRTGLAPGKTADQVANKLEKITPERYRLHAHHWLILHGRHLCKARRPECWRCPIAGLCRYRPKTAAPEEAVPAPPRPAARAASRPPKAAAAR